MRAETASIRELRTDFRSVKRKLEKHGQLIVTDNGEPAYIIKAMPKRVKVKPKLPDYYGILMKRQPQSMSEEETARFWEEERGES